MSLDDSNSNEVTFTHVLQKTDLLRSFQVSKFITSKEINDLKQLIKTAATTKEEYDSMLEAEMSKLAAFGGDSDPVPGMIFIGGDEKVTERLVSLAKKYKKQIKKHDLNKIQMCFLIESIAAELGLDSDDFDEMDETMNGPSDDSDD